MRDLAGGKKKFQKCDETDLIIERLHKNSPTVSFIVDLVPDFSYPINKQEIFSYFLLRLREKEKKSSVMLVPLIFFGCRL